MRFMNDTKDWDQMWQIEQQSCQPASLELSIA
jgi:hypothetical protein